jgi:hypothetical protein
MSKHPKKKDLSHFLTFSPKNTPILAVLNSLVIYKSKTKRIEILFKLANLNLRIRIQNLRKICIQIRVLNTDPQSVRFRTGNV